MAEAVWSMTDEGVFTLNEPYASQLTEARVTATQAWANALVGYLEPRSPYTAQELADELVKRNQERPDGKVALFEEFVLEALSGDL